MKKLILSQLMLLLMASFFIISCSKDDKEEEIIVPNPEGFFLTGTNTTASALTDAAARMPLAVIEASIKNSKGEDRDSFKTQTDIYGKYVYIGAGAKLKLTNVVGTVTKIFGAPDGGTVSNQKVDGPATIDDDIISGTLTEGAPDISVASEGFYYVFVNMTTNYFAMAKMKANLIGGATPKGWDAGTVLAQKSVSKDGVVFEGTDIKMKQDNGYRYRMFNGWQVYNADGIITINNLSVQDYTAAWVAKETKIGYFRSDIPFYESSGIYTITLAYDANTGKWTDTKVKTGDVYSITKIGLFGNGWEGGEWTPESAHGIELPTKSGDVYTWAWNSVALIADREFVVLEDGKWGGMSFLWNDGTARAGAAFTSEKIIQGYDIKDDIKVANENFHIITAGTYDIKLEINATTDAKTLTITAQ